MGNWAQLYADLTAQLQAGQHLGFWDNAFVGFYQSFVAAGRSRRRSWRCCWALRSALSSQLSARRTTNSVSDTRT